MTVPRYSSALSTYSARCVGIVGDYLGDENAIVIVEGWQLCAIGMCGE